jgi:hypothetical protein
MNKQQWKKFYRTLRIVRREAYKVTLDMMIYGTGTMMVSDDGSDPKHVPIEEMLIDEVMSDESKKMVNS